MGIAQFLYSENYKDSHLFFDIVENTFSKIEMMPTMEKSNNKLSVFIQDTYALWQKYYFELDEQEKADIICLFLLQVIFRCKEVKIYLSKDDEEFILHPSVYEEEFIENLFRVDHYGCIFYKGNSSQIMPLSGEYSVKWYEHIFRMIYFEERPQIEQPQKYEWQKLDPMPIMPEDLCNTEKRQTLDFARAVFYYAEQGHFLKLENGQYKKDNISQTLLGYMCAFILYYGINTERDIIKAPLPKPDFFSMYFYGEKKEGILRKARNEMQNKFPEKIRLCQKIVPPYAEKIDEIIKKAAKEVGIEKRVI